MTHPQRKYETPRSFYVAFLLIALGSLPGAIMGMMHVKMNPVIALVVFGVGIFAAATILTWAAEVAQMDISQSLAVAILALLAVLPEYAVDIVLTWRAGLGDEPSHHYAIANMTGANRLLVGLGWPVILFLYIWSKKKKEVVLRQDQRVEIFYLGLATAYSFIIPLKGSLTIIDTLILVTLYGMYARRAAKMESEEPELVGPVKIIANLEKVPRRLMTVLIFGFAGFVIFFVAEPFADSLIETGEVLGIDKFLLIQWLAPLASETPEFIIAATWTLRGESGAAMKALISSKVNQWTLLVGTIPLVYAIAAGMITPFDLDQLQKHELWLTAAQSIFGVAILISLRLNKTSGTLLLVLFLAQFVFQEIRVEVTIVYLVIAAVYFVLRRKDIIPTIMTGLGKK